jgi:hypothetical protein
VTHRCQPEVADQRRADEAPHGALAER